VWAGENFDVPFCGEETTVNSLAAYKPKPRDVLREGARSTGQKYCTETEHRNTYSSRLILAARMQTNHASCTFLTMARFQTNPNART
jgi:hypothetical protein